MARLIDSEVAYRFLTDQLLKVTGKYSEGVNKGLNIARSAMRNPDAIPTIDPESLRPRSYWEGVYQTGPCSFSGRCHACGVRNDIPPVEQAYYCPGCGAKMEDADEI